MKINALVLAVASSAVLTLGLSNNARAQVVDAPVPEGSVGVCAIRAELFGESGHFIVGATEERGHGEIVCKYLDGAKEVIPVFVHIRLVGLGFGGSKTRSVLAASGIGMSRYGAAGLAGRYEVARLGAEVGLVGADGGLNFTASRDGWSIPLSLSANVGVGLEASLDGGVMDIKIVEPMQRPLPRVANPDAGDQQSGDMGPDQDPYHGQ